MATYQFNVRLNKIVPHTATLAIEADNIADAIEQVRRNDGEGALWSPEGNGYWGDDLVVDTMKRTASPALDFNVQGEPVDELSLAWFKRQEAKQVAA